MGVSPEHTCPIQTALDNLSWKISQISTLVGLLVRLTDTFRSTDGICVTDDCAGLMTIGSEEMDTLSVRQTPWSEHH